VTELMGIAIVAAVIVGMVIGWVANSLTLPDGPLALLEPREP
jgi:uncharacterized membrane protein YeaQ/YmgE (transglycosylase-associated protein family)